MEQNSSNMTVSAKVALVTGLGSLLADIILYPMDAISTRLKANKFINHNAINYAITTLKNQNLNLFKGVQLSLFTTFVPTFLYVGIYDWGMKSISKRLQKYNCHQSTKLIFPFFVSSIAEIICLVFYLPAQTIRTRIQINNPQYSYKSIVQAVKDIKNQEGFPRFYKSSRLYFVSQTLSTALSFQIFQTIRYLAGPSIYWLIANSLITTCITTTLLNPFSVLLTRYSLVDTTKKKLDFGSMVKGIYKRQGIKGFYKGYITQLFNHNLYALIWFPIYQLSREKFGVQIPQ